MRYGDFSSLVQLGVGLHAGTALLQIYGEIGIQPLVRTLGRVRSLVKDSDPLNESAVADFDQLEADFDIFRIQLFNEFKKYVVINFSMAAMLIVILIVVSYNAQEPLPDTLSVFFVFISVLPAPLTLGVLWFDASRQLRPLKSRADALEHRALGHP